MAATVTPQPEKPSRACTHAGLSDKTLNNTQLPTRSTTKGIGLNTRVPLAAPQTDLFAHKLKIQTDPLLLAKRVFQATDSPSPRWGSDDTPLLFSTHWKSVDRLVPGGTDGSLMAGFVREFGAR